MTTIKRMRSSPRDIVSEHFAADRLERMGAHGAEAKRGRPRAIRMLRANGNERALQKKVTRKYGTGRVEGGFLGQQKFSKAP